MAPKNQPSKLPSQVSSLEEDESESSDESETKQYKTPLANKKPPAVSEDDSESESENVPEKKTTGKEGSKRAAESVPAGANKKVKVAEDDDEKKSSLLFERLFSEADEIVILKGLLNFVAKKGKDPVNDMDGFHGFIKEDLHVDVSRAQLQDKVRRLKKKFLNNAGKNRRTFSKAHEQRSYELSKQIWAPDGKVLGIASSSKVNVNVNFGSSMIKNILNQNNGKSAVEQNAQPSRPRSDSAVEKEIMNDGLELIERSKWEKLKVKEIELYLKKLAYAELLASVVLEASKARMN